VIRYELYQSIKVQSNNFSQILNEDELKDIVRQLDIEAVRQDVFLLFDINPGLDTQLSLKKI